MTNPIDIIANAIHIADGNHTMGAGQLAEVAVRALVSDEIVQNAVVALFSEGWEDMENMDPLDRNDLIAIARTVLGSVGGAL